MSDLWAIAVDVWNTSFLGLNVGQALVALLVVTLAFAVRGLCGWLITKFLMAYASKTTTQLDDKIVQALSGPIRLIPVIIGVYFAVLIVGLDQPDGEGPGINLVRTLLVIAIFWALHNVVTPVSYLLKPLQRTLGPVLVEWLAKTLRILFVVVGIAAVLQLWGIPVAPIVAGLGLLGVAVGLGAQDLFKNLISGLLVLTEKRFLPGEWIHDDRAPNHICEHVYGLSQAFSSFYAACPILSEKDEAVRRSRLALAALTLKQLELGLSLIGIEAPEQM